VIPVELFRALSVHYMPSSRKALSCFAAPAWNHFQVLRRAPQAHTALLAEDSRVAYAARQFSEWFCS